MFNTKGNGGFMFNIKGNGGFMPNKKVNGFVHLTNFSVEHMKWYEKCVIIFAKHNIIAKIGEPTPYENMPDTMRGFWVDEFFGDTGLAWEECGELPSWPKGESHA